MFTQIVLVAMGSAVLILTGWFCGVASERARERRLNPGRSTGPRDGLRADPAPGRRRTTVRPAYYRARAHIPYGVLEEDER